jgi:hypothetical protein
MAYTPAQIRMATIISRKSVLITATVFLAMEFRFRGTGNVLLFYALYSGNIASLLITGGHGGTRAQDAIAPIV